MLVVVGAPAVAAASCDPCPPDCEMMLQATASPATSADGHQSPGHPPDGKQTPCKQMVICQASVAAPIPQVAVAFARLSQDEARRPWRNAVAAPSHPPDQVLRPPIRL
jgi:hypothetical protein